MPAPKRPTVTADVYAELRHSMLRDYGKALAALMGPPPQAAALSDADKVRLWQVAWPREPFGPEAVQQHLQMDPKDRLRHPSVERAAELAQLGFLEEAEHVWNWPFREDTYRAGNPDPEAFVREAKRVAKLVAEQEGGPGDVDTDDRRR